MIEKIIIASLFSFAVWYTMQEGEIFGKLGDWFSDHLPPALHNPVFDCPVCMSFWYGSISYWILFHRFVIEGLAVAICAVGLSYIITKIH